MLTMVNCGKAESIGSNGIGFDSSSMYMSTGGGSGGGTVIGLLEIMESGGFTNVNVSGGKGGTHSSSYGYTGGNGGGGSSFVAQISGGVIQEIK